MMNVANTGVKHEAGDPGQASERDFFSLKNDLRVL